MPRSTDDLYDLMTRNHESTIRMEEKLKAHLENQVIHQSPPCETVQALNKRIWGALGAAVLALLGVIKALVVDNS